MRGMYKPTDVQVSYGVRGGQDLERAGFGNQEFRRLWISARGSLELSRHHHRHLTNATSIL